MIFQILDSHSQDLLPIPTMIRQGHVNINYKRVVVPLIPILNGMEAQGRGVFFLPGMVTSEQAQRYHCVFLSGDEKFRIFYGFGLLRDWNDHYCLVLWNIWMIFPYQLGMSSSQLTSVHHLSEGVGLNMAQPPTRFDSNHRWKAILGRSTTWPLGSEGSADLCGRWRINLLLGKPGNFPQNPQETSKFHWLVVSNMFFIFHNIWDNPSHWRTDIFQDG